MANPRTTINFVVYITIIVFGGILFSTNNMVTGQCQGNIQYLIQQCLSYVQRSGQLAYPSQGCCGVMRSLDLACVCQYITKDVEQVLSMEKAAFVAQTCGVPLPHGTKCGSYTVP